MDIDQKHGWKRPLRDEEWAGIKMAGSFSSENISSSRQRLKLMASTAFNLNRRHRPEDRLRTFPGGHTQVSAAEKVAGHQ